MATLHLMVGLPCSGKTTLAKQLEQKYGALRLTPDAWQIQLFGDDAATLEHDARHSKIESIMWEVARRVLELGQDVILDFGFWAKEEREDFRQRAKRMGVGFCIHYQEVSQKELMRRLEVRNQNPGQSFCISPEAMEGYMAIFQPPDQQELACSSEKAGDEDL